MPVRKSTKTWLAVLAGGILLLLIDGGGDGHGPLGPIAFVACLVSAIVLFARMLIALFRLIVHRLTLRLAFSYFLIGVVPIPLLAAMLFIAGYILSEQIIATRLRREVATLAEEARRTADLSEVRVGKDGKVLASEVSWLRPGEEARWALGLTAPAPVISNMEFWIAVPGEAGGGESSVRLMPLSDQKAGWLQKLADRSDYTLHLETGRSGAGPNFEINVGDDRRDSGSGDEPDPDPDPPEIRPRSRPKTGTGLLGREWLTGIYLEKPVAAYGEAPGTGNRVVVYIGQASPRVLFSQLFAQGMPNVASVMLRILIVIGGSLLFVYLIALAIAFVLVGAIARNVNRMTRAAQAIGRGDFSVRVNSKSRDQIGDLARSFDGMTASIQSLLVDTARKERLEGEIAIARTIQQKLLPPPQGEVPGLRLIAEFEPVAEIGGDYYDYFPMPDGRTAIAVGDVSGHGLPTGLLVAMAKAALTTLTETGLTGSPLFARLNDLIYRSTDSRNYMTLTLLAYDARTREGSLTNAGQLAPYRLGRSGVEALSLPSFPLGVSPRHEFPSRTFRFEPGDRVLFFTDGYVETTSPGGEPFGFERLEELLRAHASASAEGLRDALLAAVREHAGGRTPEDDRTMVLLTVEGKE
ncbi:MAG: SpoIIE family protein phosphatase [Thermoanaerobaculia bacterium]